MSHMANPIGVRELRRELSAVLRRVQRGESFSITSRGRTVATLGPASPATDPVTRLVQERSASPALRDVLETAPAPSTGGRPLSRQLDEDRAERL